MVSQMGVNKQRGLSLLFGSRRLALMMALISEILIQNGCSRLRTAVFRWEWALGIHLFSNEKFYTGIILTVLDGI